MPTVKGDRCQEWFEIYDRGTSSEFVSTDSMHQKFKIQTEDDFLRAHITVIRPRAKSRSSNAVELTRWPGQSVYQNCQGNGTGDLAIVRLKTSVQTCDQTGHLCGTWLPYRVKSHWP